MNALFVLAAAFVTATAGAQTLDLGGRWTLVVESPASSEGTARPRIPATTGGGWGREITITQESTRITIERHQFVANDMQPPLRYVYALGGAESRNVVNMGLGEATSNAKLADVGADELGRITGQKAVVRRATKSIAQFKLRQGMPVGAMVTLRGERMYEFLDRLISIALPRVRDFRGVSPKGFDGRGNFTLGLRDQLLFPEIDYMKVDKARGMNVSVVTSARTDEEARKLLQLMGMPFRTNQ